MIQGASRAERPKKNTAPLLSLKNSRKLDVRLSTKELVLERSEGATSLGFFYETSIPKHALKYC
jgi:hypothetical protein